MDNIKECPCGREVDLKDCDRLGTVECECGQLYNTAGQELKPVDDWFDEDGLTPDTGESRADLFGPQQDNNWW